jgi:hypothetical protein
VFIVFNVSMLFTKRCSICNFYIFQKAYIVFNVWIIFIRISSTWLGGSSATLQKMWIVDSRHDTKIISNGSTYSYKNRYLLSTTIRAKHIWVLNRYYFLFKHWYLYVFVGPIYINVVLLLRCRVISGTHLNFFKRCWVGGVEYLLSTIIKKLKINDVYTWDPIKY